jgi:hypothetical protein
LEDTRPKMLFKLGSYTKYVSGSKANFIAALFNASIALLRAMFKFSTTMS